MPRLRLFLLGILLGQLVMLPYTIYLYKTPKIEALVIPDWYEAHKKVFTFKIKNLHNKYYLGGTDLTIHIAPEAKVNMEYEGQFDDKTSVEGFYNMETNTIWCVYDPQVLVHEIRHVTEGDYHR